jgi:hypothetical protein
MRIRLAGCWVPDFAVANDSGTRRVAELARDGRPLLIDLTDRGEVAAALVDKDDRLTIAAGRAAGNAPAATSLLVRSRWLCGLGIAARATRPGRRWRTASCAHAVVRDLVGLFNVVADEQQ